MQLAPTTGRTATTARTALSMANQRPSPQRPAVALACWSPPFASQRVDGAIVDTEFDRLLVFVDELRDDGTSQEMTSITAREARDLAAALIKAADVLDSWGGVR
jgi:hypothetical protein